MRSSPQNETLVEVYRQSRERRLGDFNRTSQAMIRFNQRSAHDVRLMICEFRPKKSPDRITVEALDEAPGSDLLSHGLSHTTIGAGAFHFRVRDGIGWYHTAVSARESTEFAHTLSANSALGLGT